MTDFAHLVLAAWVPAVILAVGLYAVLLGTVRVITRRGEDQ